jgi:hypothetical protein
MIDVLTNNINNKLNGWNVFMLFPYNVSGINDDKRVSTTQEHSIDE